MACIEARGLRKAFGANVALDRIDLTVQEGRIVGLIGPNGAGKTTALKAILGLTPYEARLRRRRSSALRSRQGRRVSVQYFDPEVEQGAEAVERHDHSAPSRAGDGDRREAAGAR